MSLKRFAFIHPFLLAIFPILFLFAYNIEEAAATDLWLPIGVAIIVTLLLLLLLRLLTKDSSKMAIVTSCFWVLFFSYGHIRGLLFSAEALVSPSINLIMISLWGLLFITGAFFIIRSHRDFSVPAKFLNIVAGTLVVISLTNIGIHEIKTANNMPEMTNESVTSLRVNSADNLPDIYYIILDMYTREDTLKEFYDYDNSEFINYLTSQGFYVASNSRSNYKHTCLSLASSLNMKYFNTKEPLQRWEMIRNSEVSQLLKSCGYRYIYVSTTMDIKDIAKHAEVYSYSEAFGIRVSSFAYGILDTTALSPFARFFGSHGANTILNSFNVLADMPDIKQPKFVLAHIMCPHPPWLFDSGGPRKFSTFGQVVDDREGYRGNAAFISQKVETLVDGIFLKSDTAPIIILQGDHGNWGCKGREMDILNAYYFPGKGYDLLYTSITPVNSFRIVFNLYFGTDYELLTDESYLGWPPNLSIVPPENGAN